MILPDDESDLDLSDGLHPDDRLSARQAVKHTYFKDLRASELKEKQAAAAQGEVRAMIILHGVGRERLLCCCCASDGSVSAAALLLACLLGCCCGSC